MDRNELHESQIELGVASIETKGSSVRLFDQDGGQLPATGLSDD